MDHKLKKELRKKIGKKIDLTKTRLNDSEYEILNDLIENSGKYHGKTKTFINKYREKDPRGNYDVTKTTKYTLNSDEDGVSIREQYSYRDDDGGSWDSDITINSARDILNLLGKIIK